MTVDTLLGVGAGLLSLAAREAIADHRFLRLDLLSTLACAAAGMQQSP